MAIRTDITRERVLRALKNAENGWNLEALVRHFQPLPEERHLRRMNTLLRGMLGRGQVKEEGQAFRYVSGLEGKTTRSWVEQVEKKVRKAKPRKRVKKAG